MAVRQSKLCSGKRLQPLSPRALPQQGQHGLSRLPKWTLARAGTPIQKATGQCLAYSCSACQVRLYHAHYIHNLAAAIIYSSTQVFNHIL